MVTAERVSEVVRQRRDDFEIAEELFSRLANNETLSGDEMAFLKSLGFDGDRLKAEVSRHREKERYKNMAGTADERAAAAREDELAKTTLANELPSLENQIRQAQSRIEQLKRAAADAERKVSLQRDGVSNLCRRELLPTYLQVEYDNAIAEWRRNYGSRIEAARNRLALIDRLRRVNAKSPDTHSIQTLRDYCEPSIQRTMLTSDGKIDVEAWQNYMQELENEAVSISGELDSLERQSEAAKTAADDFLRHYLN